MIMFITQYTEYSKYLSDKVEVSEFQETAFSIFIFRFNKSRISNML